MKTSITIFAVDAMLWESDLKRYAYEYLNWNNRLIEFLFCFMSYSLFFQLGYELSDDQVQTLFWRFKAVAEQKKVIKN